MILYAEGGTEQLQADAQYVLEILCATYPNHPWAVRMDGGVVFIRHLELGSNWGMNLKFRNMTHDAAVFKKEIVMAAGEYLERAGLKRGRGGDEIMTHFEGIPEKDQRFIH